LEAQVGLAEIVALCGRDDSPRNPWLQVDPRRQPCRLRSHIQQVISQWDAPIGIQVVFVEVVVKAGARQFGAR
jgi:hypothetical protein